MSRRFASVSFFLLLLCLTLSSASLTAIAQCTQKISDLPNAPELLGFRLGMTKEQIKTLVPQTQFGRADHFGVAKTTINPFFDPKIDQSKYAGVRSISLDLLDEKLTSIWIGFDETFKVQTIAEFVKLVSQSLKVPSQWQSWRSKGQQLRCSDFQLIVSTVANGPTLRILDIAADEAVAVRRQAKEEQDSAAENTSETTESEIVGDKQSKTFFTNGCQPEREISEQNRVLFKSTEEALKAGFKLAKNCQ
jgi:hypothetical protein